MSPRITVYSRDRHSGKVGSHDMSSRDWCESNKDELYWGTELGWVDHAGEWTF